MKLRQYTDMQIRLGRATQRSSIKILISKLLNSNLWCHSKATGLKVYLSYEYSSCFYTLSYTALRHIDTHMYNHKARAVQYNMKWSWRMCISAEQLSYSYQLFGVLCRTSCREMWGCNLQNRGWRRVYKL